MSALTKMLNPRITAGVANSIIVYFSPPYYPAIQRPMQNDTSGSPTAIPMSQAHLSCQADSRVKAASSNPEQAMLWGMTSSVY